MKKIFFYSILIALVATLNLTGGLFAQTITKTDAKKTSAIINLDKSHSSANFEIKHLLFTKINGNFKNIHAQVELKKGKFSSFKGTVQANSINTQNKKRDKHLNEEDFFFTEKYKTIVLKMISQTKKNMKAELIIKGKKKIVTFKMQKAFIDDAKGNRKFGLNLAGEINRKDFSIGKKYKNAIISDKVKLKISLEFPITN